MTRTRSRPGLLPRTLTLLLGMALLLVAAPRAVYTETAVNGRLSDDPSNRLYTVPHDAAMESAVRGSDLDLLIVQHEGWQETLFSFGRLKLHEITGRTRIRGQHPSYTVLSMIYENDRWQGARILPVEHPDLLEALELDGKWVSAGQVSHSPRLMELFDRLDAHAERQRELERVRRLANAVEQVNRLGREERVLRQFEFEPVAPVMREEIVELLDSPERLREVHARRQQLEREIRAERPFHDAAARLLTRARAISQVREQFLILPDSEAAEERWVRPVALGGERPAPLAVAAREFDVNMQKAFLVADPEQVAAAAAIFLPAIERSRYYPPETYRRAMNWYVKNNPWRMAAWTYLFGAMFFGLYVFFRHRSWYGIGLGLAVLGFLLNTAAVVLRYYLKGAEHIPVSNMFEAITFCAWAVMAIALALEAFSRRAFIGVASTTMAFLLLTGAGLMPLHETRLHPLRAVLNSYWMNIHVTLMLLSYAAFAIAAFFALVYIARSLSSRESLLTGGIGGAGGLVLLGGYWLTRLLEGALAFSSGVMRMLVVTIEIALFLGGALLLVAAVVVMIGLGLRLLLGRIAPRPGEEILPMAQNEEFAYRLVQLGWPLLTLGVALGGVWANTAWGRFWGWDPKETWAFITWVAYTVYLHMRMVMGWRGRWSAVACLVGFVIVLITWLGVSYLPWFSGGLHSYASAR